MDMKVKFVAVDDEIGGFVFSKAAVPMMGHCRL